MAERELELERQACAQRRVAALLAQGREAGELAAGLRASPGCSPAERAADLDALLQLCQPRTQGTEPTAALR
jgi:hypothetical protein